MCFIILGNRDGARWKVVGLAGDGGAGILLSNVGGDCGPNAGKHIGPSPGFHPHRYPSQR